MMAEITRNDRNEASVMKVACTAIYITLPARDDVK